MYKYIYYIFTVNYFLYELHNNFLARLPFPTPHTHTHTLTHTYRDTPVNTEPQTHRRTRIQGTTKRQTHTRTHTHTHTQTHIHTHTSLLQPYPYNPKLLFLYHSVTRWSYWLSGTKVAC